MRYKIDDATIAKASPKDIRELIKCGLLSKSGRDYYVNYFKPPFAKCTFEVNYGRGHSIFPQLDDVSETRFSMSCVLTPTGEFVHVPVGEYQEFAKIIANATDLGVYWSFEECNPIIHVKSKHSTKNLLSALTGNNTFTEEIDLNDYLKYFVHTAKTIERALGDVVDFKC